MNKKKYLGKCVMALNMAIEIIIARWGQIY
jgi:hypothetical protein